MIQIVQPAPMSATVALAFRTGHAPAKHLQALVLQVTAHESYGFLLDGRLLMSFGIWPLPSERLDEHLAEFWLVIGPDAVPHLPQLVRLARLVFARLGQSQAVKLRAYVRQGHRPGARLARLVGMHMVRVAENLEIWEVRHAENPEADQRRGSAAQGPDR